MAPGAHLPSSHNWSAAVYACTHRCPPACLAGAVLARVVRGGVLASACACPPEGRVQVHKVPAALLPSFTCRGVARVPQNAPGGALTGAARHSGCAVHRLRAVPARGAGLPRLLRLHGLSCPTPCTPLQPARSAGYDWECWGTFPASFTDLPSLPLHGGAAMRAHGDEAAFAQPGELPRLPLQSLLPPCVHTCRRRRALQWKRTTARQRLRRPASCMHTSTQS